MKMHSCLSCVSAVAVCLPDDWTRAYSFCGGLVSFCGFFEGSCQKLRMRGCSSWPDDST